VHAGAVILAALRTFAHRVAPTDAFGRIRPVRVGIVDVGANTVRLLVAHTEADGVAASREDRVQVGLGEEIERSGRISERKLDEAARSAAAQVRRARRVGCSAVRVVVTSPGRQAENGQELLDRLVEATGAPTVVLSAEDEGELAWKGAVDAAPRVGDPVAVCDVGGGSAQIAVGRVDTGPSWVRSIDIGSLRIARRAFESDPPSRGDVAAANEAIASAFREVTPPMPRTAIAVGGTARALRRVVGEELTEETLTAAAELFATEPSKRLARCYGLERTRARTMTAGVLILLEVRRRLNVDLRVGRGGIREGAALTLLAELATAARSA
jgi:exopolyphosphatase/guanosine-5'-triphosphate,3'-diphosphate pyrophosphatase